VCENRKGRKERCLANGILGRARYQTIALQKGGRIVQRKRVEGVASLNTAGGGYTQRKRCEVGEKQKTVREGERNSKAWCPPDSGQSKLECPLWC